MSELIYCPECGHPKWDKDHFNCTYESLVGEASTPSELQLLVIDLGDSCVVKVEKGRWDGGTLVCRGGREDTVKVFYECFRVLREAIEQKPVPRIERDDIKIYERYRIYFNDTSYPLPLNVWDAICELAGKPLPIGEGGTWEDLLPKKGLGWELPLGIWRYTR